MKSCRTITIMKCNKPCLPCPYLVSTWTGLFSPKKLPKSPPGLQGFTSLSNLAFMLLNSLSRCWNLFSFNLPTCLPTFVLLAMFIIFEYPIDILHKRVVSIGHNTIKMNITGWLISKNQFNTVFLIFKHLNVHSLFKEYWYLIFISLN